MKKIMLTAAVAAFGLVSAQTGLKLGAHVGLPVGSMHHGYSVAVGADLAYLFPVSNEFSAGLATGYTGFIAKDSNPLNETISTIPVAATAQYMFTPNFSLAADFGYGIVANKGMKGGVYYQPKVGFHFGKSEITAGYMGISRSGHTMGAANLGYAYSFGAAN